MKRAIAYLDWNATAPLLPEVRAAMESVHDASLGGGINPSSVHAFGRTARHAVEVARARVAAATGAKPSGIVFTSGGSEANALALRGTIEAAGAEGARITRLFVSAIEHDSIRAMAEWLGQSVPGLKVATIPVTPDGVIDVEAFSTMMMEGKGRTLVSVMLANNETGVIQPLSRITAIAAGYGAIVHADAAQGLSRVDIDFGALGLHLMTLSAHKAGGPAGIGALVVRDDVQLAPLIRGGGQESGRRAGTENVAAIAGMGAAAVVAMERKSARAALRAMRDAMETRLRDADIDAIIHGAAVERLPNTTLVGINGLDAETQMMAMDLSHVCVSAGAACSSGKVHASHVLAAMGQGEEAARSAIRVSIGPTTTQADIDQFIDAYIAHAKRAARSKAARLRAV